MYNTNNLFFQVFTDRYVIIINNWLNEIIEKFPNSFLNFLLKQYINIKVDLNFLKKNFDANIYIFYKYDYFKNKKMKFSYIFLDSYLIRSFLKHYIGKSALKFEDFAKSLCDQWLPFCFLMFRKKHEYFYFLKLRQLHLFTVLLFAQNANKVFFVCIYRHFTDIDKLWRRFA